MATEREQRDAREHPINIGQNPDSAEAGAHVPGGEGRLEPDGSREALRREVARTGERATPDERGEPSDQP